MQRFQVPQFIDVEDKIFGPLTTKQFFYLLAGGGLSFLLWTFLQFWLFIILAAPVIGVTVSMAFVKVNGRPFLEVLVHSINYFLRPRLFLWKQKKMRVATESVGPAERTPGLARLTTNRLSDLSWSLDIMDKVKR